MPYHIVSNHLIYHAYPLFNEEEEEEVEEGEGVGSSIKQLLSKRT